MYFSAHILQIQKLTAKSFSLLEQIRDAKAGNYKIIFFVGEQGVSWGKERNVCFYGETSVSGQSNGIMEKSCLHFKNSFKSWVHKLFPFFCFQNNTNNTLLFYSLDERKSKKQKQNTKHYKSPQFFSTVRRKIQQM